MREKMKLQEFLSLPYEEKVRFLWRNYRAWVIAVFVGIVLLAAAVGAVKNLKRTTVMAGVTVNVELSETGKAYLTEDYKAVLQCGEKEMVYLGEMEIHRLNTTVNHDDNYYAAMSLKSLCNTHEVDYLLLDQEGFEVMLLQDVVLDLQKVFTQEELAALGDQVVTAQYEGDTAPKTVALDITHCPFLQDNAQEEKVYFVFVSASPRTEACKALLDYLLAWSNE